MLINLLQKEKGKANDKRAEVVNVVVFDAVVLP